MFLVSFSKNFISMYDNEIVVTFMQNVETAVELATDLQAMAKEKEVCT